MQLQLTDLVPDFYKPSKGLLAAINTSLFLQRPLLLAGEPGTGKTECADFVARQLFRTHPDKFNSAQALRFNTKSTSQSIDLFYNYDAVAHFGDKTGKAKENFISFSSLGVALLGTQPPNNAWKNFCNYDLEVLERKPAFGSVVLIDEIDKAPRDFPNDLLAELEKPPFKFRIREIAGFEVKQNPEKPIPIVITSNNEKGLPDAFLRRCVFHYINFPEPDDLLTIVKSNLQMENEFFVPAIATFLQIRNKNMIKRPATSELIDWISCLMQKGLLNENLSNWQQADIKYKQNIVDTLGIIAKSKPDFDTLSKEIGG